MASTLQEDPVATVKACFGRHRIAGATTSFVPGGNNQGELVVATELNRVLIENSGLPQEIKTKGIEVTIIVDQERHKRLSPIIPEELIKPVASKSRAEEKGIPRLFQPVYCTSLRNPREHFVRGKFNEFALTYLEDKINAILNGQPIEPHICLIGPPGCGKSTLLAKTAHELAKYGKYTAYLDLNWLSEFFRTQYMKKQKTELPLNEQERIMAANVIMVNCLEGLFSRAGVARAGCQKELQQILNSRDGAPFLYTFTGTDAQFQDFLEKLKQENPSLAMKLATSTLLVRSPTKGSERKEFIAEHLKRTPYVKEDLDTASTSMDAIFPPDYSTRAIVADLATIVQRITQERLPLTVENLRKYSGQYQFTLDYGSHDNGIYHPQAIFDALVPLLPGNFKSGDLKSKSKPADLAYARKLGMWAMRNVLVDGQIPSPAIARLFEKGHGTVLYAERKIDQTTNLKIKTDRDKLLAELRARLGISDKKTEE